ncbi:MAG: HTTM domain-containing protein, partial [Planctomycetota bacterium]
MTSAGEKRAGGWRQWAQRVFGMDVRSLAVFRIFLGLTVLLDVLLRFPDAEAFYSDRGVFTRETSYRFLEQFSLSGWEWCCWSWNWLSGAVWWQQLLFGLEGLGAIGLLLGWGTRLATVLVWLLVVSKHLRNPLVITSGDMLLKLMLFWSLFLPLDRVWSWSARRRGNTPGNVETWHVSIATAGFIMQVILMY